MPRPRQVTKRSWWAWEVPYFIHTYFHSANSLPTGPSFLCTENRISIWVVLVLGKYFLLLTELRPHFGNLNRNSWPCFCFGFCLFSFCLAMFHAFLETGWILNRDGADQIISWIIERGINRISSEKLIVSREFSGFRFDRTARNFMQKTGTNTSQSPSWIPHANTVNLR